MGEQRRILIVDDDESIRKVLKTILEEKGYGVDTAENGKKAMWKINARFYNLIMIDIRLPDMEGTKLLAKIKDTTPKMRKIIITGYPSTQNAVEALNKGANAYIMKPFDVEKTLATIDKQLKEQEAEVKYSQEQVTQFIETRVRELEKQKAM
jgi:two-component system response regulator PilR (NtrC family)